MQVQHQNTQNSIGNSQNFSSNQTQNGEQNSNTRSFGRPQGQNSQNSQNSQGGAGGRTFQRRGTGASGASGSNNRGGRDARRGKRQEEDSNLENKVLQVKRVTKVVKGGKNTRFSALVVVGDKAGKIGYALRKGLDYQDAVNKAVKKAKENLININISDVHSLAFPIHCKYNAATIFLKPAQSGTGLIAGGFLRPVLELAGIQNIYSKIIGSNNKIVGIQAVFKALESYEKKV
jgi:small subunit ribosomal protein S5